MLISIDCVDRNQNCRFGDTEPFEPVFSDNVSRLFRSLQKEYGRCISKMYVDRKDKTAAIGWVFLKKDKYEDSNETYLKETWVTLHDEEPEKTIQYHYHEL